MLPSATGMTAEEQALTQAVRPGTRTPESAGGDLSRPLLPVRGAGAGAGPAELGWKRGFPPLRSADHCQRHGRRRWLQGMGAGSSTEPNSCSASPNLPSHQSRGLYRL